MPTWKESAFDYEMEAANKVVWSCVKVLQDTFTRTLVGSNQPDHLLVQEAKKSADLAVNEMQKMVRAAHPILRLAGVSGAAAVILGAYGAHAFLKKDGVADEFKQVFETANKYHFLHSLALLAVPLVRRPLLTGSLFALGTLIFSGTCYYYAFTQERWIRKITPYGGFLLIFGWLSVAL